MFSKLELNDGIATTATDSERAGAPCTWVLYSVTDKRLRDRQVFPIEFGGFDWGQPLKHPRYLLPVQGFTRDFLKSTADFVQVASATRPWRQAQILLSESRWTAPSWLWRSSRLGPYLAPFIVPLVKLGSNAA
ncbi:hypothetical protein SCLCIDRAFT_630352 [Scleroderma citrinum Foug A]|uniref:Uncharacterized protein n=1 Tax=Scleroderma citrinum Foug A TaxID=1036808 RepID=A0A0C2ZS90_9AGAM|nr:hypothetical protein SCLCIDRAFT_630352 [Scleroderma citrinum Foug A]